MNEHPDENCVTEWIWPPTVMVPVRRFPVGLGATEYARVSLPVPSKPEVRVMKPALELAVQAQPGLVASAKLTAPPLAATLPWAGLSTYVQGGAATTLKVRVTAGAAR